MTYILTIWDMNGLHYSVEFEYYDNAKLCFESLQYAYEIWTIDITHCGKVLDYVSFDH